MKKMKLMLSLCLALVLVVTACGNNSKSATTAFDSNASVTLKVMYVNEQAFYTQYGNLFKSKYPNVDFDVISTMGIFGNGKDPVVEFDKIVDEQKPDIILLNTSQYEKLSADGKLYDLTSVIQEDKFDIENMVPGVIDLLKAKGGGKLYGLSPAFTTQALF